MQKMQKQFRQHGNTCSYMHRKVFRLNYLSLLYKNKKQLKSHHKVASSNPKPIQIET